ncbi:MAG: hypothetical protein IIT39_08420, partial [Clostridia bacterium]|nr:hypothetical protein [Clostridia bacterium]
EVQSPYNRITISYNRKGHRAFAVFLLSIFVGKCRRAVSDMRCRSPPPFKLTSIGSAILQLNYKQRQLAYCQRILSHKVFYDVTKLYFDRGQMPDKSEIVSIMKNNNLYHVGSDSTYGRRASTIKAWVEWIARLI